MVRNNQSYKPRDKNFIYSTKKISNIIFKKFIFCTISFTLFQILQFIWVYLSVAFEMLCWIWNFPYQNRLFSRVHHSWFHVNLYLTPGVVGITLNVGWAEPEDPYNPEHLEASERDILFNFGWFADPVVYGNYPKVMIDRIKQKSTIQNLTVSRLPVFSKEEQKNMKGL